MTFEEFVKTRKMVDSLKEVSFGNTADSGYVYAEVFYISMKGFGSSADGTVYHVMTGFDERSFSTIENAERFLWDEWADGEING